jgi:hypothetical protein
MPHSSISILAAAMALAFGLASTKNILSFNVYIKIQIKKI